MQTEVSGQYRHEYKVEVEVYSVQHNHLPRCKLEANSAIIKQQLGNQNKTINLPCLASDVLGRVPKM